MGNRRKKKKKAEDLLKKDIDLVFCYCDLDHLKYINDHYGHAEGDWYIRYFVKVVESQIRREDVFARVGGDEFCVILPNCPKEVAEEKILKIHELFEGETSKEYEKGFSCGMIAVPGEHGELKVGDLIEQADAAMYREKKIRQQSRSELRRRE